MNINFTKMQGMGNDFVVINCFEEKNLPLDLNDLAKKTCDRRYGIGADTMALITPSETNDFRIRYFNVDGSEAEMCGNGTRCITQFMIHHKVLGEKSSFEIETLAGVIRAKGVFNGKELVGTEIDMGLPTYESNGNHGICEKRLNVAGREFAYYAVGMGNPHCIIYVDHLDELDVAKYGPLIEKHPDFPNGTNVEFCELNGSDGVKCRIWERGNEETTSCGTGSCAICVAGLLSGKTERRNAVHYIGGTLVNYWNEEDGHVYMSGGLSEEVFNGTFYYNKEKPL